MAFVTIGELRKHVISDEEQPCIKVRKRTKSSFNPTRESVELSETPPVKIDTSFEILDLQG